MKSGGCEDDDERAGRDVHGEKHDKPGLVPCFPIEKLHDVMYSSKEKVHGFYRVVFLPDRPPGDLLVGHQNRDGEACLGTKGNELTKTEPPLLVSSFAVMKMGVEKMMAEGTADSKQETNGH